MNQPIAPGPLPVLGYTFDPRLEHAETPPSSWYVDPELQARERARVFARTWQLAGRADQVASPGQYLTTTVAGEPVIVTRSEDGTLLALSNVCRHRAGQVAEGTGTRRGFQCGYHGWTYDLGGHLTSARELGRIAGFERGACALPRFRAEQWGPLVFVCLDDRALPLAEVLEDLPARVGDHERWSRMRLAHSKEWVVECNWKVYVDNYLEGYHIPIVHPSLHKELDYDAYRTETRRFHSIQHAPFRATATGALAGGRAEGQQAVYAWVFPNLMLNLYPDNFSTNLILPAGPERTSMIFEWYFEEGASEARVRQTVELSDEIQLEDIRVCEAVQRGLRSRTYRAGRYSVEPENGVHHFHGLLAEHLAEPAAPGTPAGHEAGGSSLGA